MGLFLRYFIDLAIFVAVFLTQRHFQRVVLNHVKPRSSAAFLRILQVVFFAFNLWIVLAFALSYNSIAGHLHLPAGLVGWVFGGAFLWAFTSTAAYFSYSIGKFVLHRLAPKPFDPNRRRVIEAAGGALAAAPFAIVGFGAFIERTNFGVREIDIRLPDLPTDLEGLRLVQLSDIHLSAFLSERELARVIDAANETRAHVAVITGDMITMRGDPIDRCLHQLSRLRTDAGTVGCLGNHEIYADCEDYSTQHGARLGIDFLRNQARQLRFGSAVLNFAGVDYQKIAFRPQYLHGAERLTVPGAVNVLLSHNPDVFPVAVQKGYHLTLAGHTHGGQVTVEILSESLSIARFFTPFVYGRYTIGNSAAYVTRGIGTIGLPARIGAPPEISVLRLRRA
jgi:predicted MPP superfamily phosphohydrolase